MSKNYGFIPPIIAEEDFSFGSLGGTVLQEDASWMKDLPEFEHQRKAIDTQGCVSFGTLSCLEMLHKRLFGVEPNYSDRFTAKLSGTTQLGNNPKAVVQSIRHDGTVKELAWPFGPNLSWAAYYTEISRHLIVVGQAWLESHKVGYEYVNGKSERDLKAALRLSPIGVSVYAWAQNDAGHYIEGTPNHWCVLVEYKDGHPVVWDTYESRLKTLVKGYRFDYAMRYSLEKRTKKPNWIVDLFIRLFSIFK